MALSFKSLNFLGTLTSGFLLAGCSLTPAKSVTDIQIGQSFTLNQAIQIPANATRAFIQYGKITTRNAFNRRDQHCELEVREPNNSSQTVLPDHFVIEKVRTDSEMVATRYQDTLSLMTAEADTNISSDQNISSWQTLANLDNERTETMDTVMLYLKPTTKNPTIFRLTCAGSLSNGDLMDAPRSYRPQTQQINNILGSLGSLDNQSE